jgi:DNA-binding transcriptional ArsR family regulator
MGYEVVLEVLADGTRRTLVERMRHGPIPVGELAAGLPVSRPAVSKHLKLMLDAGLVSVKQDGTKRLYELHRDGLSELRDYVDGFWDEPLARFKAAAERKGKSR